MEKAFRDTIKCGKIIVFNSWLKKNRKAFCIDLNEDDNIVYRGFFGLKSVPKRLFLRFAKVVDVYDFQLPLNTIERFALKRTYMKFRGLLYKNNDKVCDFVRDLYHKKDL